MKRKNLKMSGDMKMPEFLNTKEKWDSVVESIDCVYKFDMLAVKILDEDDIDVFEFRDILRLLANDVKKKRPYDGEFITLITETICEMLDFMVKKSDEMFSRVLEKMTQVYDE